MMIGCFTVAQLDANSVPTRDPTRVQLVQGWLRVGTELEPPNCEPPAEVTLEFLLKFEPTLIFV